MRTATVRAMKQRIQKRSQAAQLWAKRSGHAFAASVSRLSLAMI
jgi:hypothetical protein